MSLVAEAFGFTWWKPATPPAARFFSSMAFPSVRSPGAGSWIPIWRATIA
jgi:hypothetical protein